MPIRIVARLEGRAARATRFLVGSAAGHLLLALGIVLASTVGPNPTLTEAAPLFVDLVSAVPQGPGEAAPPPVAEPPDPDPEPVEPEGVRAEPQRVEPKPEPEPPPKPPEKKREKKPEPPTRSPPAPQGSPPSTAPVTSPGAPGAGVGTPGAAVIGALAGVGDVELGWYKGQVTAALYRSWRKPLLDGVREPRQAHVTFEIQRDGSVREVSIIQESGVPMLDRSALSAVHDAAPLPPLPRNWRERTLSATFVFQLNPE